MRDGHDPHVATLAVKVLLAPSFVVGASLAARRYGPRIGGLVAGLAGRRRPDPARLRAHPGAAFAADAAAGTLLGLISLTAFVVVYGRLAGHSPGSLSLLAGWSRVRGGDPHLQHAHDPRRRRARPGRRRLSGWARSCSPTRFLSTPQCPAPPIWDLPLRAFCALLLVLALAAASGWLGSRLSGLLAPFPVVSSVLAVFTHTQRGADEFLRLVRGLIAGFFAFALFCFTLAVSLRTLPHRGRLRRSPPAWRCSFKGCCSRSPRARARAAAYTTGD